MVNFDGESTILVEILIREMLLEVFNAEKYQRKGIKSKEACKIPFLRRKFERFFTLMSLLMMIHTIIYRFNAIRLEGQTYSSIV